MSTKLKKADISEFLKMTYPDYRGRKFKVRISTNYYVSDSYWDGGSRTYVKAILQTEDGKFQVSEMKDGSMFCGNRIEGSSFVIPINVMIVEHSFFCGKDAGITFVVSANSNFLPNAIEG